MSDFIPNEEDTITLTLDDGTEIECAVLAVFPVGEQDYIALLPLDDEEEGEVYLYRFSEEEDGEEITLDDIEDDEEFERVSDAFDELLDSEEFDELVAFGSLNPMTRAPSRLAAVSKLSRVRVEGSKNRVATTFPSSRCRFGRSSNCFAISSM